MLPCDGHAARESSDRGNHLVQIQYIQPHSPPTTSNTPQTRATTQNKNNINRDTIPTMLSFSQPLSFMGTKKIKGKHLTSVNALSRANYSLIPSSVAKPLFKTDTQRSQTKSTARTLSLPGTVALPLTPMTQYVQLPQASSLSGCCYHPWSPIDTLHLLGD